MTGTKIITRINASEAAEVISRLIGEQQVERRMRSETRAAGDRPKRWSLTSRLALRSIRCSQVSDPGAPSMLWPRNFIGLDRRAKWNEVR
jgi:hypothetical protein